MAISFLGGMVLPERGSRAWLVLLVGVVCLWVARELGLLHFPLPHLRRQTQEFWSKVFPRVIAAALWGLDLGLVFSTKLTFSGAFLLATLAFFQGEHLFGGTLFVTYWIGRALSVWIAPLLIPTGADTAYLQARIYSQRALFKQLHFAGLLLFIGTLSSKLVIDSVK